MAQNKVRSIAVQVRTVRCYRVSLYVLIKCGVWFSGLYAGLRTRDQGVVYRLYSVDLGVGVRVVSSGEGLRVVDCDGL